MADPLENPVTVETPLETLETPLETLETPLETLETPADIKRFDQNHGRLGIPSPRPESPRPMCCPSVCPLRSACVIQNIFQFQRASRGHGLLRTTGRYDASSNTISRSVADSRTMPWMRQGYHIPRACLQTQMPAHTQHLGRQEAKAVSSPACSD
jgi:hypothetical protein